ncbi:MAG: tetratricopeptide repeat protein, partial [Bacteroidetes bacterium]
RELILFLLKDNIRINELFPEEDYKKCLLRYQKDREEIIQNVEFDDLIYYADLSDLYKAINGNNRFLSVELRKYISSITKELDNLVPIRNRIAHSRPLNTNDFPTTLDLSKEFVKNNPQIWKNLNNTVIRLKDEPSFVIDLQIPNFYDYEYESNHNLPIPDFDDTGFIGREKQVEKLVNYCLGPYPVITVVGEGGLGKTAIALRVAYDVLDLPKCPFDSVVWTSSKTSQITATEIIKIKGAISDSVGIMKDISFNLSGKEVVDPVKEILEYMKEFKILLIIDNLETVLDDRIKEFLSNLPKGSKVLITSRIGLGAFEVPEKLLPMDNGDSVQLLRSLAHIKQVNTLVKINNKQLEGFCSKLQNNPGYIKWFVSAVQIGKRPEEVLAKPDIFLDYCMSNVYEYLNPNSKKVLKSLVAIAGQLSLSELAFLNDIADIVEIKSAVNQLLTTNMVLMYSIPNSSTYESFYTISDLARDYLVNKNVLTTNEFNEYNKKNRQLVAASELIKSETRENPFSFNSINVRSKSDFIVAKLLLEALREVRKSSFVLANQLIIKAKGLAPQYYEVLRVEAQVKFFEKNHLAAKTAYEAAIELEPKSAPLHVWYGGFLLRVLNDLDEALKHFEEALKINPDEPQILLEIARINLYQFSFDKSKLVINKLLKRTDLPVWSIKKVHDLNLQYYRRYAEYSLKNHDYSNVVTLLEEMIIAFKNCPVKIIDNKMLTTVSDTHYLFHSCLKLLKNKISFDISESVEKIENWFHSILGSNDIGEFNSKTKRYLGIINRIEIERKFGIIMIEGGKTFMFFQSGLINPYDWQKIKKEVRVSFQIKKTERDEIAEQIQIIE